MSEKKAKIVINTGPIISLVAAMGNLDILQKLFDQVYVPLEVKDEILMSASKQFAAREFIDAAFLTKAEKYQRINPFLQNVLDRGEASVIQMAIDKEITTVCIDEKAGRRIAKLNNLQLTGSVGILIKAKNSGYISSIRKAIESMKSKGIYLSESVINFALEMTEEKK